MRTTVTTSALERVQVIEQRVMARENLLNIAEKFNLYSDGGKSRSATEVVDKLRDDVKIEQVLSDGSTYRPDAVAFRVSFEYGNPTVTAQIVSEIVSIILAEDLRARTSQAEDTTRFLKNEADRLLRELKSVETEIAKFKEQHSDNLPESLGYRQSLLLRNQTELALLNRDIEELKQGTTGGVSQIDQLISKVKLDLAHARAAYTESHPRVRQLVQQLNELESEAQSQQSSSAETTDGEAVETAPDPLTQKKLDAALQQRADLQKNIDDLEASISQTGQVELGFSSLQRDYAEVQREYRDVNAKLAQAETAERMEENRQSERLEVIEQAVVPQAPVWPNRKIILALGLFASAAVGLGPVAAFEVLDPNIKRERDLETRLGRRALAVIPMIETQRDVRRRRRIRRLAFFALLILLAAGAAAIHLYYMPLDILWYKALAVLNSTNG